MIKQPSEQGKFTGTHMVIIMVAFFGVIITVNLTMAMLASRSWTGLVVKNSYVESQKFNSTLQNSRAQAALNWTGVLSQSINGVEFELRADDGKIIAVDKVDLTFKRPATEQLDQTIALKSDGVGLYVGDIKLGIGTWAAEVVAHVSGKSSKSTTWQMNYNIYVENDGSFNSVTNKTK